MCRKALSPLFTSLFLGAEGVLYAVFLALDFTAWAGQSIWLKYTGILLCLLFVLACACAGGPRLLVPPMALTAVADLFLLVLDRLYPLGVALFFLVQLLYLLHLYRTGAGLGLPLRLGLALVFCLSLWPMGLFSLLNLLAALYFSQLLSNAVLAWRVKSTAHRRFALGLALFVGCDLCVGLFNLGALVPAGLYAAASFGMWLFYLPAQVLISLSALPEKGEL